LKIDIGDVTLTAVSQKKTGVPTMTPIQIFGSSNTMLLQITFPAPDPDEE
jgi:hypothetical protein